MLPPVVDLIVFDEFANVGSVRFVVEGVFELREGVVGRVASGHPETVGLLGVNLAGWNEFGDSFGEPELIVFTGVFGDKMSENFWSQEITAVGGEVGSSVFRSWLFDEAVENFCIGVIIDGGVFLDFFVWNELAANDSASVRVFLEGIHEVFDGGLAINHVVGIDGDEGFVGVD